MNQTNEVAQALAAKVKQGIGLREAIVEQDLPLKPTLLWLKKEHRSMFRDAKAEFRAATIS